MHWTADGCEFISGFGDAEGIALLKRFYEIGNPRTTGADESDEAKMSVDVLADTRATGGVD